jgi:hypothetical protein
MKLRSPLRVQRGGEFVSMATIIDIWTNIIQPAMAQQFRILPDSILVGSGIMALLTQSFSTSMFFVAMLETSIIGGLLRSFFTQKDMKHTLPGVSEDPTACDPSLAHSTLETLFSFGRTNIHSSFPSFPVLFLSTAVSYVVGSLWQQKEELTALGSNFAARFYIAVILSGLFLFTLIAYRISSGCEGAGIVLMTLFLGLLLGAALLYQNTYLFGRDSTNMIGVPLLRERTRDGKPLYVCTQPVSTISNP